MYVINMFTASRHSVQLCLWCWLLPCYSDVVWYSEWGEIWSKLWCLPLANDAEPNTWMSDTVNVWSTYHYILIHTTVSSTATRRPCINARKNGEPECRTLDS